MSATVTDAHVTTTATAHKQARQEAFTATDGTGEATCFATVFLEFLLVVLELLPTDVRIESILNQDSAVFVIAQRSATVAVSQEDADLINSRRAGIAVRPVGNDSLVRPATLEREYVVTTQRKQNGKAVGPKESRFAFELGVASAADLPYGQALKVRFDLGWAPLSVQVWRSLHIWYEKLMLSRYINDAG